MSNKEMVSLNDAIEQIKKTATRLALLHLGFSKILSEEFGEEKAKELIIKSIVEYGKLVGKHQKQDNLPFFGLYEKQSYKDQEFVDLRKIPLSKDEKFDFKYFKAYGCAIGMTFIELQEKELGQLYCYIDAAKSMSEDLEKKLIHTDCVLCGDDYCTFKYSSTSEKEKEDFKNNDKDWKNVDPLLLKKNKNNKARA